MIRGLFRFIFSFFTHIVEEIVDDGHLNNRREPIITPIHSAAVEERNLPSIRMD